MEQETLIGLILMIVLGPAVGNYATSVVYRLPLGQSPFEKHPYCGSCGAMLQPKDLFPILSYLWRRGKCGYCGVRIPPVHTVVEVVTGALFIVNFLVFGVSEAFILITALGVFLIILAALEVMQGKLYHLILTYCFSIAAMLRAAQDASIYPMVQDAFLLFFAAVVLWRVGLALSRGRWGAKPEGQSGYWLPGYVMLAGLMGVALPIDKALIALAAAIGLYALQRIFTRSSAYGVAAGLGIWAGFLL